MPSTRLNVRVLPLPALSPFYSLLQCETIWQTNSHSTLRRVIVGRFRLGRKGFNNTAQQSRFVSAIWGWRFERTTYCRHSSFFWRTSPLQKRVSSADRDDMSHDRQQREPPRAFRHSATAPLADLQFQFNDRESIEIFTSKNFLIIFIKLSRSFYYRTTFSCINIGINIYFE